jgi:GntR family transcriptional repressor for pyruvate dehydrogenase complex
MHPGAVPKTPTTSSEARPAGVTASVVTHLEDLVLGELEPGSELPSESDVAAALGVSRLTVREATKSLQARGLIDVRQGRRPIVAHPNAGPIGDFFAAAVRRDPRRLMDLLEVRRALEVQIATLAATRASRAAIHESIAEGAGNQMLAFLIEAMEQPLRSARMQSMQGHLARGGTVSDVIDQHAAILERVKARDEAGAATAMRQHLAQTARDLRAFLELRGVTPEPSSDATKEESA